MMAANRQQGTYLATTLTGFTAFPAGIAVGGGKGMLIAIVGLALLVLSAVGFYRIKGETSVS
ncbi:MAG TPA: hypothetical protein VMU45_14365 [Candidatus Eisenbacteria bacterium]|nr:hypothetical protein [Candidatus Eisenbacteria bacterium]